METSKTCVAEGELQQLDAPISVTPEQLEAVVGGLAFGPGGVPRVVGVIINPPLTQNGSFWNWWNHRITGVVPLHWNFGS